LRITTTFVSLSFINFGPNSAGIVLGSALRRSGIDLKVRYLDINLGESTLDQALWSLLASDASLFAFSLYSWNVLPAVCLVRGLRVARPGTKIVAGGSGTLLVADADRALFDCITDQPGEQALVEFLGGEPEASEASLSSRAYMDRNDSYVTAFPRKDVICYDASRGCPFRCEFCFDGRQSTRSVRRPREVIREELSFLASNGYELIDIADNNANEDRACFETYLDSAHSYASTRFHFEARAELFDKPLASAAAALPNIQLGVGIQTALKSEGRTIRRINNYEKAYTVLADWMNIDERRCSISLDLIFGLPDQTLGTFRQSFDWTARLYPNKILLNHYREFQTLPDSPQSAILSADLGYAIAHSPTLSVDDMVSIRQFRRVFMGLQSLGQWTVGINMALVRDNQSAYVFYQDLAEECGDDVELDGVVEAALAALQDRVAAKSYHILRNAISAPGPQQHSGHWLFPVSDDWAFRRVQANGLAR